MPGKNKNTKSSSISRNLHWVTRPSASIRDLALWGADVLGAPSHITNAVRDVSNRVANLPIIGLDAAYNYATGNSSTWEDAFKEADTNPSALASAFEVFPITNTESNYSDDQLANQYELRKHSPGKPGQITHDGYRYINKGRYAGDVGIENFFSPSKVNEWSIGQTSGVSDEEGNTYTSDLFAYDTKDTNNVYLKAVKEGKASPAMFLRGALGVVGAKGYDDGTNSATAIRTKIDTKAQKKAYDTQNKKAYGGSLRPSWDDLSLTEKSEMMKVAIKNGITDLSTIRQKYNEFAEGGEIPDDGEDIKTILNKVNSSKANFVSRLKDPNRKHIEDWASDGVATHKLGVATDEHGNHYIYPEVQEINGKLVDFTRPPYVPWAGQVTAEERGDTVRVPSIEEGVRFTENYKKYYPKGNTFSGGGDTDSDDTTYSVGTGNFPEFTVEAQRTTTPYTYYDPWSRRYKGIGVGGQRIEYGEGFNPEGSILLPNAQAYENQRLIRAKQDDLNHTYDFGNKMRNIALAATVAPMAGPLVEAAQVVGDAAYAGYKALPWLTQQLTGKGAQAAFAADGLYNFFGPEGTRKTTRLINEGKYGDAALSAAGDILNLSMAAPALEAGQALIKAAKPVADKTISFLNSPLTGKWTTIGNRQYRLSPNSLGANGVPIESRTPQITVENAASITPEQWTAAQDAAIAKGDMVEAQRLRDLHTSIKGKHKTGYKGQSAYLEHPYYDGARNINGLTTGNFNSSSENVAATYAKDIHTGKEGILLKNYIFSDNPYIIDAKGRGYEEVVDELSTDEVVNKVIKLGKNDGIIINNIDDALLSIGSKPLKKKLRIADDIVGFPGRTKLADAVTFDDNGRRIGLGDRDNFNVNDIRYYESPNKEAMRGTKYIEQTPSATSLDAEQQLAQRLESYTPKVGENGLAGYKPLSSSDVINIPEEAVEKQIQRFVDSGMTREDAIEYLKEQFGYGAMTQNGKTFLLPEKYMITNPEYMKAHDAVHRVLRFDDSFSIPGAEGLNPNEAVAMISGEIKPSLGIQANEPLTEKMLDKWLKTTNDKITGRYGFSSKIKDKKKFLEWANKVAPGMLPWFLGGTTAATVYNLGTKQ